MGGGSERCTALQVVDGVRRLSVKRTDDRRRKGEATARIQLRGSNSSVRQCTTPVSSVRGRESFSDGHRL